MQIKQNSIKWNGVALSLQSHKLAKQATASVSCSYGGTNILCTVMINPEVNKESLGFVPLTSSFAAKSYAFGKIPKNFFKREGKLSEQEILISRLIDRSIRPLIDKNFNYNIQLNCILLNHDGQNSPDIPAIIGSIAAISMAGVPISKLVAAVRVGYCDGNYILNKVPINNSLEESLNLVICGDESSILMVESSMFDTQQEELLSAAKYGMQNLKQPLDLLKDFCSDATPFVGDENDVIKLNDITALENKFIEYLKKEKYEDFYKEKSKKIRTAQTRRFFNKLKKQTIDDKDNIYTELEITCAANNALRSFTRDFIVENQKRLDGRAYDEIREITMELDVLPNAHGSALFTRGDTQALVVVTLGTDQDAQISEYNENYEYSDNKQNFILHYNFPSFSVGETSSKGGIGPGRREIGHGNLAKKALKFAVPNKKIFPYTIRVVSEILESDGSSSLATVCGSSLAMMDAGVPIKKSIVGVAMGLIKHKEKEIILSDISGDEDGCGDMDFKISGTEKGITVLQLDVKNDGVVVETLSSAITTAMAGIKKINTLMSDLISEPRKKFKDSAPIISSMEIPKNKIGEVIGSGGRIIRDICDKHNVKIDVDSNGLVTIAATDRASCNATKQVIGDIVQSIEAGTSYDCTVVKLHPSVIFIEFMGGKQGFINIKNRDGKKEQTSAKEGDVIAAVFVGMERGKFKFVFPGASATSFNNAKSRSSMGLFSENYKKQKYENKGFNFKEKGNYDNNYKKSKHKEPKFF